VGCLPPRRYRQRGGGPRGWGLHHGDLFHLRGGGARGRTQGAATRAEGADGRDGGAQCRGAGVLRPQAALAVLPTLRLPGLGSWHPRWAWAVRRTRNYVTYRWRRAAKTQVRTAVSPPSLARRCSEHQIRGLALPTVIISMIIRTIRRPPSGPAGIDSAPHVSKAALIRTDRSDAGQPTTDLGFRSCT